MREAAECTVEDTGEVEKCDKKLHTLDSRSHEVAKQRSHVPRLPGQ